MDGLERDPSLALRNVVLGNHHFLDQLPRLRANLTVFISSAFTDAFEERSILLYEVLPILKHKASRQGISVQFLDMKFGIKDETTKEYDAWDLYKREIVRCHQESDGVFFISLLADRYGYQPLPAIVPSEAVEAARSKIKSNYKPGDGDINKALDEAMALLDKWYELDENAMPPHYVLRQWSSDAAATTEFWERAYPCLIELMKDSIFDVTRQGVHGASALMVGHGAMEWELRTALDLNSKQVLHFRRQLHEVHLEAGKDKGKDKGDVKIPRELCDVQAASAGHARKLLLTLGEDLRHRAEPDHRVDVGTVGVKSYMVRRETGNADEECQRYIKGFRALAETALLHSLELVARHQDAWRAHLRANGVDAAQLAEMLHHQHIQRHKCAQFIGRTKLVTAATDILLGSRPPRDSADPYGCLTLAVVGPSGSGKTALMAVLAERLRASEALGREAPVIVRFCGTSLKSGDGLSLVRSIVWQVKVAYGLTLQESRKEETTVGGATSALEYEAALGELHSLLATRPVALFVDGAEQLSNKFEERSRLSFLRDCPLHEDSVIVVSCLPDVFDSAASRWVQNFGTDTLLAAQRAPRVEVPSLAANGEDEVEALLLMMLERDGRRVQHSQWPAVWRGVQAEPSVLYLSVVCSVVRHWRSGDTTENPELGLAGLTVAGTLKGVADQLLDGLEQRFGKFLVRHVAGFLTFSNAGVTDAEMVDLLTLAEDVLKEVMLVYRLRTVKRVPDHCWLRVRHELRPLLLESFDGTLHWAHRRLREVVKDRYLADGGQGGVRPSRQEVHRLLGVYFADLDPAHSRKLRLVQSQPLLVSAPPAPAPTTAVAAAEAHHAHAAAGLAEIEESEVFRAGAVVNTRRSVEAFHQLVKAKMYAEAIKELCDINHVCAWARAGLGFELLKDITVMTAGVSSYKTSATAGLLAQQQSSQSKDAVANSVRRSSLAAGSGAQVARYLGAQAAGHGHGHGQGQSAGPAAVKSLEAMLTLFEHYCRWVSADMYTIMKDPAVHIVATGLKQARVSLVRTEVEARTWHFGAQGQGWKCRRFGGLSQFSSLISSLPAHEVTSLALSGDGGMVASGSLDRTIRLWDSYTGQCLHTLEGHTDVVTAVCMTTDGAKVVSASADRSVKVWDVVGDGGRCALSLTGHEDAVSALAITPDSTRVISGSWDRSVRVWNLRSGECVKTLVGHQGRVLAVGVSLDGARAVSGGEDKRVVVWDLASGKHLSEHKNCPHEVRAVCLSADGSAVYGSGPEVLRKGSALGKHEGAVLAVRKTVDGNAVLSCGEDGALRVWNNQGKLVNTFKEHIGPVTALAVAADGSRLLTGSLDGTIKIWDAKNITVEASSEGHTSAVTALSLSADQSRVVSGGADNCVKVWDVQTGDCTRTLVGHSAPITAVAASADASKVVTASADKTVKVWIVASGKCNHSLAEHTAEVADLSLAGDRAATVARDGLVKVWDIAKGKCLLTLRHPESGAPTCVHQSADGKALVTGGADGRVHVWDQGAKQVARSWEAHVLPVSRVFVSTGGELVLSVGADNCAKVWDARSGVCVLAVESGPGDAITGGCLSVDYRRALVFYTNEAKVFDLGTGLVAETFLDHHSAAGLCVITADGTKLVTASLDHTLTLWAHSAGVDFADDAIEEEGLGLGAGSAVWCSM